MIRIEADTRRIIRIGYAGEDKVTQIIYSYPEEWLEYGDGEFKIRVLRPESTEPYNAANVEVDTQNHTLTMTVTDVELSIAGYGEMQVVYICSDAVKKSGIYQYRVSKSIDEAVAPPAGSVITEIVESLSELESTIETLQGSIDGKANAQDVTTLSESVNDLTDTVNGLNDELGLLEQAAQDYMTLTNNALDTKADKTTATASADGLMSSQDKTRLDSIYEDYSAALSALGGGS